MAMNKVSLGMCVHVCVFVCVHTYIWVMTSADPWIIKASCLDIRVGSRRAQEMRGNSLPVHIRVHVGEMQAAIVGPYHVWLSWRGRILRLHMCVRHQHNCTEALCRSIVLS